MERETTSSRGSSRKLSLEQIAAMTNATINKIQFSNSRERLHNGTTVTYHDCTSVGYGWLLPGWVAEERRVQSGRIYRYYYDPNGSFYESQQKVLEFLEQFWGIIVLDT
ncbi:uncharacterized protein LOC124829407 [Vigna umbellata]|uniref:uncharacterized protein LOC124829407 n=1 Tax=Vigna umbellata TaxID=87088 RepID=UPI001F5EBD80|nr:uncharacterized protein LOC124829407 [Vigna umbellata]